jgi:hypothetical protein
LFAPLEGDQAGDKDKPDREDTLLTTRLTTRLTTDEVKLRLNNI